MKGISFIFLLIANLAFGYITAQENKAIVIDPKIQEVYRDAMYLLNDDPARLKALTKLLNERVEIVKSKQLKGEKEPKLSEFPLFNNYNKDLKRDTEFDVNSFNVLKYNLDFFSNYKIIYRIDNTDYLIVIHSNI